MKSIKFWAAISVSVALLTACQEGVFISEIHLTGDVYNGLNNEPWGIGKIHLVEIEEDSRPFSSIVRTVIAEQTLSADGSFEFYFDPKSRSKFKYEVEFVADDWKFFANEGYTNTNVVRVDEVDKRKREQDISLTVYPVGLVYVSVKNIAPVGPDDQIEVFLDHPLLETRLLYYIGEQESNTQEYLPILAGDLHYYWRSVKGGVVEEFSETLTLEYGTSIELNIEY